MGKPISINRYQEIVYRYPMDSDIIKPRIHSNREFLTLQMPVKHCQVHSIKIIV